MESFATLNARAAVATQAEKAQRTSDERLARFNDNPVQYLQRRAAIGWGMDVPRGADPVVAARAIAEIETMSSVVKGMTPPAPAATEPEDVGAGYSQFRLQSAITDAILTIRQERSQRRANAFTDERDEIKSAFNPVFADVGLRLMRIPNWVRSERTIMEPRLR